ncbi:acetoin dehydrogenase dihydrolipoyllysine-residue acetyltransferase subunit [Marivita sp. S0852]|uniref:acetoin dehydrogenase dihydrolipoyllysine-residue acetyltransferase subunit n=1 Tax=Marivita sp. S0852 TaxID=3373893 RepID=UPI0039819495
MSTLTRLTLPMPRLGETMEEGTIAEWLVQLGQSFARGDPLIEVETDKTMVEYPALGSGTLTKMLVAPGDIVKVGTPIAVIETTDSWDGIDAASDPVPEADPPQATEAVPEVSRGAAPNPPGDASRPRATPLARRLAKRNRVSLEQVNGSGRRGRIEADDVRALIGDTPHPAPAVDRSVPVDTPVFCVHGFAGLGSNWASLRAALQRLGLTSSAPDLPGHGRNPADAIDVTSLIDWLIGQLRHYPRPVHLVGHSLGAHVALKAALHDPARVSRLTILAPAGCGPEINGAFISGMAAAPNIGELAHLMRLLGRKAAQLDTAALSGLSLDLMGQRLSTLAADAARGDVQRIDSIEPLRALSEQIPVRALFGLSDTIIPRAHAFHLPPRVACHMLDTGHMPHWDATEDVARIIAAT